MPRKKPEPRQPGPDWYLVEWMAARDMTQAELGRRTGWGKARASDIVNGTTEYYRQIVNAAAAALEVHPFELFMTPAEAHHIRRLRAVHEEEYRLRRVAEQQDAFAPAEPAPARLAPRRKVN